jgi:hypothetical protein
MLLSLPTGKTVPALVLAETVALVALLEALFLPALAAGIE